MSDESKTPPFSGNLRKKKLELDLDIVDHIPNDSTDQQKVNRVGNSKNIVIPSKWDMHLYSESDDIVKVLVKVRLRLNPLAYVETYGMLVLDGAFPLDKAVKD